MPNSEVGYQIYGKIVPDILFSIARQRGRVAYPVLFVVFGSKYHWIGANIPSCRYTDAETLGIPTHTKTDLEIFDISDFFKVG